MNLEYWINRFHSGINYDTMIGWDEATRDDEAKKIYDHFKEVFKDLKYNKVLDYGCGLGRFSKLFDCQYIGTDIVSEVIEKNKKEMPDKEWIKMYDYQESDLEDLIFLCTVFQYFDDEEAVLSLSSEFYNAKNIVIIESLASKDAVLRAHEHNRQPEKLKELIKTTGWKIKKESYFTSRENYYLVWLTK